MKLNLSFLKKDNKLLKKYNEFCEKIANIIYKELDSNPVYNEKYIKTKIKSYNGKTNTNFYDNKIPKEVSQVIFLLVVLIDSVLRAGQNYYSLVFLEECKQVIKVKKIHSYITDDMEISDYDKENSDE